MLVESENTRKRVFGRSASGAGRGSAPQTTYSWIKEGKGKGRTIREVGAEGQDSGGEDGMTLSQYSQNPLTLSLRHAANP